MFTQAVQVKINNNWLFFISVIFCLAIASIYPNIESAARPENRIINHVAYVVDSENALSINDLMALPEKRWQQQAQAFLSFGMSTATYWFKFTLPAQEPSQEQLLSLDAPLLDSVSVWFADNGQISASYQTGDTLPFAQRPVSHENFIFPTPNHSSTLTVYLKIKTSGALRLPINVWPELHYLDFSAQHGLVMGLFFGFMLAIFASNVFFFLTTKVATFAIYSAYVGFLGLTLATLHGLGYKHLWPEFPWLQQHALPFFANLTVAFLIIFCDLLLDVKSHNQKLSRVLQIIAGLYLLSAIVSLFAPLTMLASAFLIMLLLSGVLIYGVGIWIWIKGESIAGVYTVAWSVLFFSGLVICLDNLNIVKLNLPSDYLLVIGASIETLLLALVLAMNHNQQTRALKLARDQLLANAIEDKKTQADMLNLQESAKEELEYKVQERTLELEITLRELSEKNRELEEKNTLDALTGVRNRSYFDKKYIAEIRRSRRERTQLSIVMLDIDHFKNINDRYGHLVGDDCIKSVAKTIKQALKRPSDDLCRYGGEEFVLILPSTELVGATALVENIRQTLEQTVVHSDGFEINLTISAGIATAVAEPNQADELILAAADQQLYQAKNEGRNKVKGVFLNQSEYLKQD